MQLYHRSESLSIPAFWRTAISLAIIHGAICFFIPYYSVANGDRNSITDLWSVGKTIWVAVIGVVTLEILLVSRYQTKLFLAVTLISYGLVYPYVIILPLIFNAFNTRDPAQVCVGVLPANADEFFNSCPWSAQVAFHQLIIRNPQNATKNQDTSCMISL